MMTPFFAGGAQAAPCPRGPSPHDTPLVPIACVPAVDAKATPFRYARPLAKGGPMTIENENVRAWLGDAPAQVRETCNQSLARVEAMRTEQTIYPPQDDILNALAWTGPADVRVVILGQDPYHGPGQAMGLSFSVHAGCKLPPSLRNIYKELVADLGCDMPATGDLSNWARQGVLLLNTTLTVREHAANSHAKLGGRSRTTWCGAAASCRSPWCFSPGARTPSGSWAMPWRPRVPTCPAPTSSALPRHIPRRSRPRALPRTYARSWARSPSRAPIGCW